MNFIQIETTHLGRGSIGTGEELRTDYIAIGKAIAPAFVHSHDAAVLKLSFPAWHQPIALIHDYIKVLPNYIDKVKESFHHGFIQVRKGDPLARLADEEVSSEQLIRLTQGSGDLSAVLDLSSYVV